MTPLGWSGWDQERVMLSTVRLTWCIMDTVDGAAGGEGGGGDKERLLRTRRMNQYRLHESRTQGFTASLIWETNTGVLRRCTT